MKRKKGFTLIEILVVVLVIGVLAAVALPLYNKAVMKSRFADLMPIAKALVDTNEEYYLARGHYSSNPNELSINVANLQQGGYLNGLNIFLSNVEELSFVLVNNPQTLSNVRYVVYQKNSANLPDTSWCEANDDAGVELCISLGGQEYSGNSTGEEGWRAFLLTGLVREGDSLVAAGGSNNTPLVCDAGYCKKEGACVPCDYMGTQTCTALSGCSNKTFGENSGCSKPSRYPATCISATFSDESYCTNQANCRLATFTDDAICKDSAYCRGAVFEGNSTCAANCNRSYSEPAVYDYPTTFKDESTCTGHCYGSVFEGNSSCTSNWGGSCSNTDFGEKSISIFKDHAVCAGSGCDTAIYENDACCSNCTVGSGKPRCSGGVW